jgi:predicted permease
MVLLYAVPLALFVGTVGTPRADLVQDITLVVALFAAIVGLYALVFLLFRLVFRFSLSESVLAALTASAPAVPFMGPAILGDLFGKASSVTIAIAALIINLVVVPITILGLALEKTSIGTTAPPTTPHSVFAEKLLETVKQPIVWAPLLAFVLVLCNVRVPSIVDHGLSLLGQATGGVAVRFRHHACRLQNRNRFDSNIVGVLEESRSACAGPGWTALTWLRRAHRP